MIIKTKEFKEVCKAILVAQEGVANNNLELKAKDGFLYLAVTNQEYYCAIKFQLEDSSANFRSVVDANLFLSLVSGINVDTFELSNTDTNLVIKVGKSSYKLPMIYRNDELAIVAPITISNKTVTMPISNDILKSILNVNSKELLKLKNIDSNELQHLYYINESGCFTFSSGATLNSFKLDKPVKMLLNDRIVKLFRLFNEDVLFSLGYDTVKDTIQTKVSFETDSIYLAALINCADFMLSTIQGPCTATKNFIDTKYSNNLVINTNTLLSAISRLLLFTKNSVDKANMRLIPAKVVITQNELTIYDNLENVEVITLGTGSYVEDTYEMTLNLADLKLILESYKDEYITMNCGNHRSVVITKGQIHNLLPEI